MTLLATNRLHQLLDSLAATAELVDKVAEGVLLWQTRRASDFLDLWVDQVEGPFKAWADCRDSLEMSMDLDYRVEGAAFAVWGEMVRGFYGEGYQVGHVMVRVSPAVFRCVP